MLPPAYAALFVPLIGFGINQNRLTKHLNNPSQELLQKWDPILCVIADELSIDLTFFGLWEEALSNIKECRELFGGLVTALKFNHCQLKLVHGLAVNKKSKGHKALSQVQERGHLVYQSIRKVVYLTQNMRFKDDPEWGEWLARARVGQWDDALKRFITNCPSPLDEHHDVEGFVQIVSSDNATRMHVNETVTRLDANKLSSARRVFAIPADLSKAVILVELTNPQFFRHAHGHHPDVLHCFYWCVFAFHLDSS